MNRVFKNASIAAKIAGLIEEHTSKVVKTRGKEEYCVKSESNSDWSGGCYPSKAKAESRLDEVEAFKHMKKRKSSESAPALPRVEQVLNTLKVYVDDRNPRGSINALRNLVLNLADLVDEGDELLVKSLVGKFAPVVSRMSEIGRIHDIINPRGLKKLLDNVSKAVGTMDSEELRYIAQFIRDALQSARMAALVKIARKIAAV